MKSVRLPLLAASVTPPGLINATIEGPQLLSGGSFGPESLLFAILFCTARGVRLAVMADWRSPPVVPPCLG